MKIKFKQFFIIILLLGLFNCFLAKTQAATTQSSKPAAPYTKQASDRIMKYVKYYGQPTPPIKAKITSSDVLDTYIKYFIKVYGVAGYNFNKSMGKYVHDININAQAFSVPPFYEYAIPETMSYLALSDIYHGNNDEIILKKYFSQEVVNSFNRKLAKRKAKNGNRQTCKSCVPAIKLPDKMGEYIIEGMPISFATCFPHSSMIKNSFGEEIISISRYPARKDNSILFKDISSGIFPSLNDPSEIKESWLISEDGVLKAKQIEQSGKIICITDPEKLANEVYITDISTQYSENIGGKTPEDILTVSYSNGKKEIYATYVSTEQDRWGNCKTTRKQQKTILGKAGNVIETKDFIPNAQTSALE